jgi:hypothetical protein
MSHLIRARLDPSGAPSDKTTRFEEWLAAFETVGTDSGYTENPARPDGTAVAYDELVGRFAVGEDPDAVVDDLLNNRFPDASWLVVHTRQDDAEAEDLDSDETYYDPAMIDGVRSTPQFRLPDGGGLFSRDHGEVHAVVGGEEATAAAGTITVEQPDSPTTYEVRAAADGSLSVDGSGVLVATVECDPGRIRSVEPEAFSLPSTEFTQDTVRGSPPAYIADESEPFPDRLSRTEVVREHISEETSQALKDARNNGNTQEQLDHILDVLDVIDL